MKKNPNHRSIYGKFKQILAFGDSHIAGCELSDTIYSYKSLNTAIEDMDAEGKKKSFPQLVANALGIPCYNYAMTGGSNTRSMRCLYKALLKHNESLVLFGYTYTDRSEFYYPDRGDVIGRDIDKFVQTGMQWDCVSNNSKQDPINLYYQYILRPFNNLDQLSFYVDAVCQIYAKHCIHLPLTPEPFNKNFQTFDFEGHGSYINWCQQKQFKELAFGHYDQTAHQALSRLILKHLEEQEL